MSFIDNLFVFPQAVAIEGHLRCNITGDGLLLKFDDSLIDIKMADLYGDSTTIVLYNEPTQEMVLVQQWEKLVSEAGVTARQALQYLRRACFLQIDYYQGKYFIKVFLPINQLVLASDTNNFTFNSCFPLDFLHPIDWQYHITADVLSAVVKEGILTLELDIIPSVLFDQGMYLNYGDRTIQLAEGLNHVALPYVEGQLVHFSDKPGHRGMGNCIQVENYL